MTFTITGAGLGTRKAAASLCGISPRTYSLWVKKGIMPGPVEGTRRYDLNAVILRIEEWRTKDTRKTLTPAQPVETDFQRWLRENGHEG
jgi:hypothetical protein